MKPREIKRLTATLKAIADPTRRAIYDLVWNSKKKESISTVTKEFKITRQGITKHLKILSAGDLIELKRIGRVTYCIAHNEALQRAENWIGNYREIEAEANVISEHEKAEKVIESVSEVEHQSGEILDGVANAVKRAEEISPEAAEKDEFTTELIEESAEETVIDLSSEKELIPEEDESINSDLVHEVRAEKEISTETQLEETEEIAIASAEEELDEDGKPQLLQMSIDPNDPGTPIKTKEESAAEEPILKEAKEKPIEVTENQLDIYGIRKEPKLDESNQQFELF